MPHIPGPWTYTLGEDRNQYNGRITASDGKELVLRAVMNSEDAATMHLIASAPDLLAALQNIAACDIGNDASDEDIWEAATTSVEIARAVIAKATTD